MVQLVFSILSFIYLEKINNKQPLMDFQFLILLVGFAIGIAFVKSISLGSSLRYAFVAIISGAVSLIAVNQSPYANYKFYAAIAAGWGFFFIIKSLTIILERFSDAPVKNLSVLVTTIIQLLSAWRKK